MAREEERDKEEALRAAPVFVQGLTNREKQMQYRQELDKQATNFEKCLLISFVSLLTVCSFKVAERVANGKMEEQRHQAQLGKAFPFCFTPRTC